MKLVLWAPATDRWVVFTRTQAQIYSARCTSERCLSHSFPSLQAGEKTATKAKSSWFSAWLLVLTRDLALLSHLTSLPLVPSLKKKDQKKLDLTRQDSSPQETSPGSVVENRSSSPRRTAWHSRNGAKCKGQTQTVTSDTPRLIFNLWKWFSWAPTTQLPVAGIK